MRIEITEPLPIDQLEPGDIYTNRDQEWWDLALQAQQIAVVLYVRSEFPLPQAYEGTSFRRVIIHKDEVGLLPSQEVHIADDPPEDEEDTPEEPFHCSSCGGMGTEDGGKPCRPCQGTGVTPQEVID